MRPATLAIALVSFALAGLGRGATPGDDRVAAWIVLLEDEDCLRRERAERFLLEQAPARVVELAGDAGSAALPLHTRWRIARMAVDLADPAAVTPRSPSPLLSPPEPGATFDGEPDPGAAPSQVRQLLLELQAGRYYSTDAPAFLALAGLGEAATEDFLAAIEDPELSSTLRHYAFLAFQRAAGAEVINGVLPRILAQVDSQMLPSLGSALRQERQDPAGLVAIASGGDPALRRRAISALGSMIYSSSGEEAAYRRAVLGALQAALADPDRDVVLDALTSLRNQGQDAAGEAVFKLARSGDTEVAIAALECLRYSRLPEALTLAVKLLDSPSPHLRARAVAILASSGRMQAQRDGGIDIEALLGQASRDPHLGVRVAAYEGIGMMGSYYLGLAPALRDRLVALLDDPDAPAPELEGLTRALGNLGDHGAIDVLVRVAQRALPPPAPPVVTAESEAETAAAADAALEQFFAQEEEEPEDLANQTTMQALSALRRLAARADAETGARITELFRALLPTRHRRARYEVAQYLLGLQREDLLPEIAPYAFDSDYSLRSTVASLLGRFTGSEPAALLLVRMLIEEREPSLRRTVVATLGMVGVSSEAVVVALEAAKADDDPEVARAAGDALTRLQSSTKPEQENDR